MQLLIVVRRALEREDLEQEVRTLHERVAEPYRFHRILSQSPRMQELSERLRNLADLDTTVLVTGEIGTGKELVAHAIHYNSQRRDKRFVVALQASPRPSTWNCRSKKDASRSSPTTKRLISRNG